MTRVAGAMVAIVACAMGRTPGQSADLQRVLDAAAGYLERYEREVKSVVLEERYLQRVPGDGLKRTLRSDLVIVSDANEGWIELRDVLEVDGRALGDQRDRIVALLSKPVPDAFVHARRLADESARFNLHPARARFHRSVNVPFTALRFLRRANQSRSSWHLDRTERVASQTVALLRFEETATPRLIGSKQQFAASGAFWIAEDGAVLRTELRTPEPMLATIRVSYARHPTLGWWLPEAMQELYRVRPNPRVLIDVDGRATYSNVRQFKVDTAISVK